MWACSAHPNTIYNNMNISGYCNIQVRDWNFVVISVHLKAEGWEGKSKGQVEVNYIK